LRRLEAGSLTSALGIGRGDLVALVGGGGKTTLMYRLTQELFASGLRAAAATTTKIAVPEASDPAELLCAPEFRELVERLLVGSGRPRVLGKRVLDNGKVEGVPTEWCDRLLAEGVVEVLVVEADGAARKPLKAPEAWEPVVPEGTTVFVAVVGLSCLGHPLDEETVFRARLASAATGAPIGAPVTTEVVTRLLESPNGLCKGRPKVAQLVAVLNQADTKNDQILGRKIANSILKGSAHYDRVVISTLGAQAPIREVWVP